MILSRYRQRLSSSMAVEGGLLVHILPLYLPCPPCLDIECPFPVAKEVWLPCLLSLELNWFLLMAVVFRICYLPSLVRLPHTGISSSQSQASFSPFSPLAHSVPFTSIQRSTQWDPCLPTQAEGIRRTMWGPLSRHVGLLLYHTEDGRREHHLE